MMVTANVATAMGIANGTAATLQGVIWSEVPTFSSLRVPMANHMITVQLPTTGRPTGLILRLDNVPPDSVLREGWPPGCAVLSLRQVQASITLPVPGARVGLSFSVTVSQFPVLPRMACTGHKVQGLTMDSILIPRWKGATGQWAYVVLSRVRTRQGLFMLEQPAADFWAGARPSFELATDHRRLLRLDAQISQQLKDA